ncbi:MAG: hypothetical protein IJ147_01645 [Lachnospiraceae bacterium]|nr:hypothetical protein [Lachnospiraceae bacterium]
MSVETLQIITLILFVLSAIFFVLAACLFFAFNVPGIVGSMSGMTAKKAIENIKARNEENDRERVSYSRLLKDKRTEKIAASSRLIRQTGSFRHGKNTQKINKTGEMVPQNKNYGETVRLDNVETVQAVETSVLITDREEIHLTQLEGEMPMFTVDVDIVLCESTEEIL